MTANQIAYQNMLESKRSNLAKESENIRHNVATEDETKRTNLSNEAIKAGSLSETIRHNKTGELLGVAQLSETTRHNKAGERETNRHNLVGEEQNWQSIDDNWNLKSRELSDKYAIAQMQDTTERRGQDFKLGGTALQSGLNVFGQGLGSYLKGVLG